MAWHSTLNAGVRERYDKAKLMAKKLMVGDRQETPNTPTFKATQKMKKQQTKVDNIHTLS